MAHAVFLGGNQMEQTANQFLGREPVGRLMKKYAVNKACFIFLQAMGKAVESTALSMIREIVFGVGFAVILPLFFGLDGVLYSMPVSDIMTFAVALFLIIRIYKELSPQHTRIGTEMEYQVDMK